MDTGLGEARGLREGEPRDSVRLDGCPSGDGHASLSPGRQSRMCRPQPPDLRSFSNEAEKLGFSVEPPSSSM